MNIRTISIRGRLYIRKEDVVDILLELATDEPIDTQNRIDALVSSINKLD